MKSTFLIWILIYSIPLFSGCSGSSSDSTPKLTQTTEQLRLMGRHENLNNGNLRFGASGFTIIARFKGTRIEAELRDEFRDGSSYNWFTVFINDEEVNRFRTQRRQTRYVLADNLADTVHTVKLVKDSEGQNGWVTFEGLYAENFEAPPELPARKIEFIGDSITCGAAMDESIHPCGSTNRYFDQNRASHSFGVKLANHFDAQYMLTAVSGMGMYRNWNSSSPVMPDRYDGIYADFKEGQPEWDHHRYRPDLIVIGLGTNDFSSGSGESPREPFDEEKFFNTYADFVERIRQLHPQADILHLASPMLDAEREQQHAELLHRIPDAEVHRFEERYTSGCDQHPDVEEHTRMAEELKPVIANVIGW